jgi:hypothetical protein
VIRCKGGRERQRDLKQYKGKETHILLRRRFRLRWNNEMPVTVSQQPLLHWCASLLNNTAPTTAQNEIRSWWRPSPCRKEANVICLNYECISKSFRTGRLERELQMVQLSATRCSCIAILWVSLVSFAAITLCVASQRVFIVVVVFVIDSVRKLLDTPSYLKAWNIK